MRFCDSWLSGVVGKNEWKKRRTKEKISKIATASGQVTIEGTWRYAGGTGQFQGITGGGTYKGRMTSPVEFENSWEGKYQLAAKTQAA